MTDGEDRAAVFERERAHLLAVAFRILGSDADAQDVVQDAWTRFVRGDVRDVRNVQAWLTTVVTRLCLDVLRRSREYPHRPEDLPPVVDDRDDPEELAVLSGELTRALAVVVGELTPPQRVAFVLHDVFGTPFEEVAHILGTTPGSAKKLASRARGRLHRTATPAPPAGGPDPREARRVVGAFLDATRRGDLDGLVRVLHPDVTRTSDPQVLAPGAALRVEGARAVAAETRVFQKTARSARLVTVDGRPALAVGSRRAPLAVLLFHIAGGRIVHYDVVADPDRLALLTIED